jgi:hypothetical protein
MHVCNQEGSKEKGVCGLCVSGPIVYVVSAKLRRYKLCSLDVADAVHVRKAAVVGECE